MLYDFGNFKKRGEEIRNWLKSEFINIHTGRAAPQILDGILVNSYGSRLPINQVAGMSVEDARTLRIAPWNADTIRDIEVAINEANLGVSVRVDEKGLRVSFPELTGERREALSKAVRSHLEEANVSLRTERDKVWQEIQKMEKGGEIGEDDKFRLKDEMEKLTKETKEKLDQMAEQKTKDLMVT